MVSLVFKFLSTLVLIHIFFNLIFPLSSNMTYYLIDNNDIVFIIIDKYLKEIKMGL